MRSRRAPRLAHRKKAKHSKTKRSTFGIRLFPKIWTDLRKSGLFCDASIQSADGKTRRVHRIIMVAASEYFRAVFMSPISPGPHIRLPFSSDIVDCIIDYCYTGKCHVGFDNIKSLLPAADQIGVLRIVRDCTTFLNERITVSNCWGIYSFSRDYFLCQIAHTAMQCMTINFESFYKCCEFTEMPFEDLVALVSHDFLNVKNEESVFYALHRWIMSGENREQHATKLFQSARLGLVSSNFFTEVVLNVPYIDQVDPLFLNQLSEEIKERESLIMSSKLSVTPLTKPRVPYEVLFAVGGWSAGRPTNCIETYDIRANRWFLARQFDSTPLAYHGLVSVDNFLYVIGGFNGFQHFNSVRCHNPVTKKWTEKACMYHARCYVCCVTHGKDIYAIGGFDGRDRMSSVEKYSIAKNQWSLIIPLNRLRSDAGAAVVGSKIFVIGGFNGHMVLDSAEVFDINTGIWTMLPPMNRPRSGVSLVYYKGYIYAIGGFSGTDRLSSVERLDPNHPTAWTLDVPDMLTRRSNFACTVMDDMIYVIGGYNGWTTTGDTERFDGKQWHEVSSMNLNRSALSVCICRGLSNAVDYTLHSELKSNDGNATGDYNCDDPSDPASNFDYED